MTVNLKELAEIFRSIENDLDEHRYLDTRDGQIHFFRYYDEQMGEECGDESYDSISENYIKPFPGRSEFREYDTMEQFAQLQLDIGNCNQLMQSIGGLDTFRRFRMTAKRLGLLQEWYDYQERAWIDFARNWCHAYGVDYEPKLPEYSYRPAVLDDLKLVTDLLCKLYYKSKAKTKLHRAELLEKNRTHFADKRQMMFLAYDGDKPIGIAHVSLRREYVEGAHDSGPTGYLEAVYVEPDYRLKSVARELVWQCRMWAVKNDCKQFASDCELDNADSYKFHVSIGFQETSRNVHFIEDLIYTAIAMRDDDGKSE
jgi:aminoglycoside 6'-N-acetyltransferase I